MAGKNVGQCMMKHPTTKVYFITSKSDLILNDCIKHHLPDINAHKVITSGGVWIDKKRCLNPGQMILKNTTLKCMFHQRKGIGIIFQMNLLLKKRPIGWPYSRTLDYNFNGSFKSIFQFIGRFK